MQFKHVLLSFALLLPYFIFGQQPLLEDFKKLDIPALHGKTHSQLRLQPGVETVDNWGGWENVYFMFNKNGKLMGLNFKPKTELSIEFAKEILTKQFNLELNDRFVNNAQAQTSYVNMPGKIKRINLMYADWKSNNKTVGEIGVYFNIGWDE